MSFAKPLTELTTIWLDNVMDGVPQGDVTNCSLSVIVPCHGHLATWHSVTVFIGEVLFLFLCSRFFLSELIDWFVGRHNQHYVFKRYCLTCLHLHRPGLPVLEGDDVGLSWCPETSGICAWPVSEASRCKCGITYSG
jgi:hypothetical protein